MVVVVLSAIGSGLAVVASTYPSLGPVAILVASVIASIVALLTGLLLAYIRSREPLTPSRRIGVSDGAISTRAANDPLPAQKRAS